MIAPLECLKKQAGKHTAPKNRQEHNHQNAPTQEQGDKYHRDQDKNEARPLGFETIRQPANSQWQRKHEVRQE